VLLLLAFVLPRIDLDLNLHTYLPSFVCHVPHVRIRNWYYTTLALTLKEDNNILVYVQVGGKAELPSRTLIPY